MHRPGIIGARPHHGGAPYVGPLDIVPGAIFAVAQRAMSAAKRGTALYTIADGAGGATQSFNSDATTGLAPTAAILSYSATPFTALWNDQSGGAHDAALSDGALLRGWAAESDGLGGLVFPGTGPVPRLVTAAGFTTPQDATVFLVAKKPTGTNIGRFFLGTFGDIFNGPYLNVGAYSASNIFFVDRADNGFNSECGGESSAQTPSSDFILLQLVASFGNNSLTINGVDVFVKSYDFGPGPIGTFSGTLVVGAPDDTSGNNYDVCDIKEILIYPRVVSSLPLLQNIAAANGITLG